MADEDTPDEQLERIAGEQLQGEGESPPPDVLEVPRCPNCNRAMDDIEDMDEAALLGLLRLGALKMLARNVREGQLTHQELAVLRGLLRDNSSALNPLHPDRDAGDDDESELPSRSRTSVPPRRPRPEFDDTEE